MPESYSSIGEAIGAAMQHNIRLAHGHSPAAEPPLQVRYLPSPAADPYSVPGMIVRLEESASPQEVAGIIEETTGALVGPLPQLTELVAATADWARARLSFDDPHHNPTYEVWTRLGYAHLLLTQAQGELEAAVAGVAACPAELSDPRHRVVQVLRTRELLHDVMGAGPTPEADREAIRQQAALAGSPNAPAQRRTAPGSAPAVPAASPPPAPAAPATGRAR